MQAGPDTDREAVRQAGLVLGNSVWASSLTLAAFMTGLAIGNAVIARYGDRVRNPIRLYAGLEIVIAVVGASLVWVLPFLAGWLAPAWRPLIDQPLILNALRLLTSFALLLVPAIAMGATLPLLTRFCTEALGEAGDRVGLLYAVNTAGAVFGTWAAGFVLLPAWGLWQTTVAAALGRQALNLHGWVYKFETGQVFGYDPRDGQFVPIEGSSYAAPSATRTLPPI